MGEVIAAEHLFLRRAIRLAPSSDPWADAIMQTVMRYWPDAPDDVVDGFAIFVTAYAEQANKGAPEQLNLDWLWQHFRRFNSSPNGAA